MSSRLSVFVSSCLFVKCLYKTEMMTVVISGKGYGSGCVMYQEHVGVELALFFIGEYLNIQIYID